MLDNKERKNRILKRKKRYLLKNIMSSFMVTGVIATVAIVMIAKIPKVILTVETFGNTIYYETVITDQESSDNEETYEGNIANDSLVIVLESQLEQYQNALEIGSNYGTFNNLMLNTKYTILIQADLGYGMITLEKQTIRTMSGYGGLITNIQEATVEEIEGPHSWLTYNITTNYSDTLNEISALYFRYAYGYGMVAPLLEEYNYILVTETTQTHSIIVPDSNVVVYLVLEAILITDETIIFDTKEFNTPLFIDISLYQMDAGPNYISVSLYPYFVPDLDITYRAKLIKNGEVLETKIVLFESGLEFTPDTTVEFSGLAINTMYHVIVEAEYLDLETNKPKTEEISRIDVYTTLYYEASLTFNEGIYRLEIIDLSLVIMDAIFIVWKDEAIYYEENIYIIYEEDKWFGQFSYTPTGSGSYRIEIVSSKTINEAIVFYRKPINITDIIINIS